MRTEIRGQEGGGRRVLPPVDALRETAPRAAARTCNLSDCLCIFGSPGF
jgi:hypothetical protein